jgi:hypothetical protein
LTPGTPVSHLPPQSGSNCTKKEASGAEGRAESATATRMTRTGARKRIIDSVTLLVGMALGIVTHYKDRNFSRSLSGATCAYLPRFLATQDTIWAHGTEDMDLLGRSNTQIRACEGSA